jgi:ribosomal protein S4
MLAFITKKLSKYKKFVKKGDSGRKIFSTNEGGVGKNFVAQGSNSYGKFRKGNLNKNSSGFAGRQGYKYKKVIRGDKRSKYKVKSIFKLNFTNRGFKVFDSIIHRRFKIMTRLKRIEPNLYYKLALKYQTLRWLSDYKFARNISKYKRAVWSLESQGLKRKITQRRMSNYAVSLHDKQKLKYFYLGLSEHSLKNIVRRVFDLKANRLDSFVNFLESRLITLLFRFNVSDSLKKIKTMIRLGLVVIDGKVITDINYQVEPGSLISFKDDFKFLYMKSKKKVIKKRYSLFFYPSNYVEVSFPLLNFIFFRSPVVKDIPYFFNLNLGRVLFFYNNKGLR